MFDGNEVILITGAEQILHLTGIRAEGVLLIDGKEKRLFTDARYYGQAKRADNGVDTFVETGDLSTATANLHGKKIGVDYSVTVASVYEKLKSEFEVFDAASLINEAVSVKDEKQLALVKKACEIAENAFLSVVGRIKRGVSENELAGELEYAFRKFGAEGVSFDTIVAFGENSAVPHHATGNEKLKDDSVVLMDFGCRYGGYCSDMTRTLFFGEPNEKFLGCYSAVRNAHELAYSRIRAGMSCREADKIARDYLEGKGLAKYFTHSLGHGIGTLIHEYPTLSPRSDAKLAEGNVFSIEPGIYFDGEFGIRIENTVALAGGRPRSFMKSGLELTVIKNS